MNKKNRLIKHRYLIFFGTTILIIVLILLFVQNSINSQKSDAEFINVSGKQRMLVERILRHTYIVDVVKNSDSNLILHTRDTINSLTKKWEDATNYLILKNKKYGNKTIDSLFKVIEPYQNEILKYSRGVVNSVDSGIVKKDIKTIEAAGLSFLTTMDTIVFEYQKSAENKLENFKIKIFLLAFIVGLILILEYIFIILPFYKEVSKKNQDLELRNNELLISQKEISNNLNELGIFKDEIARGAKLGKIFIEQAPNAIAMFDKEMKYIATSQRWREDYNLTDRELLENHIMIFSQKLVMIGKRIIKSV